MQFFDIFVYIRAFGFWVDMLTFWIYISIVLSPFLLLTYELLSTLNFQLTYFPTSFYSKLSTYILSNFFQL